MAEEKKEPWLNYLALTTVLLAVLATLSTFNGGKFSTRSLLAQSQASDQWSYYQSKSIKGYLYELQKEKLELDLKTLSAPGALSSYREALRRAEEKLAKYEAEKAQASAEAKRLEKAREEAQHHGRFFGIAVIYLQIGILLCSISALMKRKAFWLAGTALGLVGLAYFLNGFFVFIG